MMHSESLKELLSRYPLPTIRERAVRLRRLRELEYQIDEVRERCTTLRGFVAEAWHVPEPLTRFVAGYHIDAICDHLEAISHGEFNRLLINIPPGHMKSLLVSVFWQAWEWGPLDRPGLRYLSASWSEDYVKRDTRKTRDLVASDWYQRLWGDRVHLTRMGERSFENSKRGTREGKPFQSLTGGRGDRVVVDDPHSTEKAESDAERAKTMRIARESLPSRVNDSVRSAIVVIMQRLHEGDVSGEILSKELGYEHLMLPTEFEPTRASYTPVRPSRDKKAKPIAVRWDRRGNRYVPVGKEGKGEYELTDKAKEEIEKRPVRKLFLQDWRKVDGDLLFPERFPRKEVDRDKRTMGSYAVAGQFQQRPTAREGGMFKRAWFADKIVGAAPAADMVWVRYWDLAGTKNKTSPKTAGVLMGFHIPTRDIFVGHVETFQEESPQMRKNIKLRAQLDEGRYGKGRVDIGLPQDPGQAGKAQKRDLIVMLHGFVVHAFIETGSKVTRAEPFAAQCEAGSVFLVEGDWNEDYIAELTLFPGGAFADQTDASSGAYSMLVSRMPESEDLGAPISVSGGREIQRG